MNIEYMTITDVQYQHEHKIHSVKLAAAKSFLLLLPPLSTVCVTIQEGKGENPRRAMQ